MARKARIKDVNRPHHIMSRSIQELNLYNCDKDKEHYLALMKKATFVYRITIIAYCLMDNHVHLMVHPNGGDIGEFMKSINNPYANYYNTLYERKGHLFADRYKNVVIQSEVQLLRTSTYIHNNAKDLLWKGYRSIVDYPYSSLCDYINPEKGRAIANPALIFKFINGKGAKVRNHYKFLLEIQSQGHEIFEKEVEKAFKKGTYESDKVQVVRNITPQKVLSTLAMLLQMNVPELPLEKYKRGKKIYKCLASIGLRIFCGMTLKDMTEIFRGYTASCIGHLSDEGYKMIMKDGMYDKLIKALSD